jgi:hypothetical protein
MFSLTSCGFIRNFNQLALSKDGTSHCLYFLHAGYNDPSFTSAEDAEDPMVIMKIDTKNAFVISRVFTGIGRTVRQNFV